MDRCQVDGCTRTVSKAGHAFCLDHWKAERNGMVKRYATCQQWHENGGPPNANPLCRACKQRPAGDDESAENDSPGGKGVYIEFCGHESDPTYQKRKAAKQAIYAKHGLRLIELGDAEIERLDDVLPRTLLRFGIESV